ncbi:uncharacterized protein LOC143433131 [Xylocopa sonorina]|uniref:uncharacterized protein LOC143433131 n=1 Tax=Xylocopa sonorina TaxID=1818115 RepID=UPI00403A8ACA
MYTTMCEQSSKQHENAICSRVERVLSRKLCAYVIVSLIFIVEYYSFCLQPKKIRMLFECIKRDWNDVQGNEDELNILRNCMSIARQCTIFCATVMTLTVITFAMAHLLPVLLDVVVPLNESRQRELIVPISLFFHRNSFTFKFLYLMTVGIFGTYGIITAETTFALLVRHSCGLLKITSYKIEHSLDWDENQVSSRHKRTVFQALLVLPNLKEFLIILMFTVTHFLLCALPNYSIQNVIDHNRDIFVQTYFVKWYETPVSIQKLYLFLMLKTTKDTKIILGLFVPSVEGFSKLMNITFSYFMVLCSTRMGTMGTERFETKDQILHLISQLHSICVLGCLG